MLEACLLVDPPTPGRLSPSLPQNKITQQQAGRAITSKGGGHSTKERHNLVVDLGNHAQETITDMQRAFVQVPPTPCLLLGFTCVPGGSGCARARTYQPLR